MTFSLKEKTKICLIYGLIVCGANIVSVMIPGLIQSSGIRGAEMVPWIQFLSDYNVITDLVQIMTFVLPAVLCVLYTHTGGSKTEKRLINLPFAFSVIGISGWALYILEEFAMLKIAGSLGYEINFQKIFSSSVMFVLLEATISFTLSYFLMNIIHVRWFIKKNYPDGSFIKIPGIKHPSAGLLFFANYVSVTLFPVLFLIYVLFVHKNLYNFELDSNIFYLLCFIFVIGIVTSVSFLRSISVPMKKLEDRVKALKEGDELSKVYINSNDGFGELGYTFNEMTESIAAKNVRIAEIQDSIIEGMAMMVESRDNSTGGHIKRTSQCVRVFIEELKNRPEGKQLTDSFCRSMIKAAPMHDLGKIAVDDAILRKPGKFEPEEYEKMKNHSAEGARIVSEVLKNSDDEEFKNIARNVAHYHHEKWNGTGYPAGLKEKDIPFEARIMAFADVFDALVSKRCYKDAFTFDRAFEIIQNDAGTHFDPELAPVFLSVRPRLERLYRSSGE